MLTLPIKKKWFDMILRGEKKEEYREIKPYWEVRLEKVMSEAAFENYGCDDIFSVKFRNGYKKDSPYFVALCLLKKGKGKVKWGAEKDKEYFIFEILDIGEVNK